MLNELYYIVYDQLNNIKTPIKCGGYQIDDGWVVFYKGVEVDHVVMALPPNGFWFQEVGFQEYSNVLADLEEEDPEEAEARLDAALGMR